jgi:thiamine kinase-like enzyme
MTAEEESEVISSLANIPPLAGYRGEIQRLGGLTNRVYALGEFVLRIPGKGTEDYINRGNEMVMAREAAAAGVSPALIHGDAATGIMVTTRIDGATTLSPEGFKSIPGAVARAGGALCKLHTSGRTFPSRFELFAMIDDYLKIIAGKSVALPAGYDDVVREAQGIRVALNKSPAPLAPCHCDPLCENFLDTGSRMWIVDWEYGGMNDPMWDLGDLSVEGGFTPEQDDALLRAYFHSYPSPRDHGRMVIYKAMCDLLWTLWGLIQHANANPADDFKAYAENRFARCKALMATPEFAKHVAAVAAD